jgi:hypothetical protein
MITVDMYRSLTSFCDQQTDCIRCEFNGFDPCPIRLILIMGDSQKVVA